MAKLRIIEDNEPGITRKRSGAGWAYFNPNGSRIRSQTKIARLNAVALPPAYKQAWFARDGDAHILATGIDARGRKQYRYHPDFRAGQDESKFDKLLTFGKALPAIRRQVARDLARKTLHKDRIVAAVVRLLDECYIRVGNEAYATSNKSFGATTLRNRHAKASGTSVTIEYRGKSGKDHSIRIEDRRLATLVRRLQDVPGQHLFQYVDDSGARYPVSSSDVNDYLRACGGDFTAKDFRTFAATTIAFESWVANEGKVPLKSILEEVASKLGNTPAIARKSYIHPHILNAVAQNHPRPKTIPRTTAQMSRTERGMLAFLEKARKNGR